MTNRTFIIRPNSLAGTPTKMDIDPFTFLRQTEEDVLVGVARRFAENVGLMVVSFENNVDNSGNKYIDFTIGTDRSFTAFDAAILEK